jgi:hypothetical protein
MGLFIASSVNIDAPASPVSHYFYKNVNCEIRKNAKRKAQNAKRLKPVNGEWVGDAYAVACHPEAGENPHVIPEAAKRRRGS